MNQLLQNLQTGQTTLTTLPAPQPAPGQVLIRTHSSLVSLGTERMLVEFGKASLLAKARQQPEKVKQVLNKIQTDGLMPTVEAVKRKLSAPIPLGYCNAGEVIAVGKGVKNFKPRDRVVSNGPHAEIVSVPQNLVAHIPDNVSYHQAAFTVIGAIGLQGIRLINPTFGETIVVSGLGLIGLLSVQFLNANGCRVIGLDLDAAKVKLAQELGVEAIHLNKNTDIVADILQKTSGIGADGVLITASTKSNELISQAAQMSRKRGRIVLVGVIGLNLQRADFYEKELSFQVSCSYGPGRYDTLYEQKGQDYPIGFVRWTEQRNFEAVLRAIKTGQVQVNPLITEVVPFKDYQKIYGDISRRDKIASILEYPVANNGESTRTLIDIHIKSFAGEKGVLGIIGAGNFTGATLLPALKKIKANIKGIASSKGLTGTVLAKKFGIAQSTTDYRSLLNDPEIEGLIITTRHHLHAAQTIEALKAGKHVFVEKPLALNIKELLLIRAAWEGQNKTISVGFNRRFSPFAQKAKKLLGNQPSPIQVVCQINAGSIPSDHWTQDLDIGGGRIIGEACHFIDLITYLTGSLVESVVMNALGTNPKANTDNATLLLRYQNGAQGTIHYFSNGHPSFPKEKIDIYHQGKIISINNFRKMEFFGYKKSKFKKRQDKGHQQQFALWVERLKAGGEALIPWSEIENTTLAGFAALQSLKENSWTDLDKLSGYKNT